MRTRTIRIIDENDSQLQVFYLRKVKLSPKTYSKDQRHDPKYKFQPIRVAVITHEAFQENANPALVM